LTKLTAAIGVGPIPLFRQARGGRRQL